MPARPRYRRALVKVSGESFSGPGRTGIDPAALTALVAELLPVARMGVQMAVVVGAGNLIRGRDLAGRESIRRLTADYMGMTATVINALALRDALDAGGQPARVLSALDMAGVCEPFIVGRAIRHLEKGRVVILAGGTGSPFFTTDTGAALRAREIEANVILKATKVDGVFDKDPATNPKARKFDRLTYQQVLEGRLGVMDLTAISMCLESRIPIVVLQLSRPGSLAAAVRGEPVGTTISE